jgi:glucose/arabinose dehydrogenase
MILLVSLAIFEYRFILWRKKIMNMKKLCIFFFFPLMLLFLNGCYSIKSSSGGGEGVDFSGSRNTNPGDIALPEGYSIQLVAHKLTFPTGIAFDDEGTPYVTESGYSYGEVFMEPRLVKINADGSIETFAAGTKNGPWNGVWYHNGSFYVAEGGQIDGGKILRIDKQGKSTALIENLPSVGDHHTNGPVVHDGYIYFGQGTATNSAVVGEDNHQFGWLGRNSDFHDIPCRDITLAGANYSTKNILEEGSGEDVTTGAFLPFGTPSDSGQVIKGSVPCSGAVMRIPLKGGNPELVAWGFRNPYGLAFNGSGELYVTDNGYDERGSRKVWGTGDYLWKVEQGQWYGWPDFSGGHELSDGHLEVPGEGKPQRILAEYPGEPPRPAALFGVHSSSNGFDFSRSGSFGFEGDAFVAQFGDMAPGVGKVYKPVGFKVVKVNPETGVIHDFVVNKKKYGPASRLKKGGIERPVAVRFSPDGSEMYIVDFGVMLTMDKGPVPVEQTGVVWKVTKSGQQ